MSSVIIEFEGFQLQPDSFIVKELAFFDVKYGYHGRWSFLAPHPWEQLSAKHRKTFSWLTHHCHGIQWDYGDLPYSALQLILTSLFVSYTDIYSKGLEKCKFLEKLCGRKILDLNDFKCPKIYDLKVKSILNCPSHESHFQHCALAKAAAYGSFIKEQFFSTPVICTHHVNRGASQTSEQM